MITIVGGGAIGLSVARCLSQASRKHGRSVFLLEKHFRFGMETSSRNSEVIHSSIYYDKSSLKGQLCLRGQELMYDICAKNNIPHKNMGKLIVATCEEEKPALAKVLATARGNGARGVRIVDKAEIAAMEPNVYAVGAVYAPRSGVVDSNALMTFYEGAATQNGAEVLYNVSVEGVEPLTKPSAATDSTQPLGYKLTIKDRDGSISDFETDILINCAGLHSGTISEMVGLDVDKLNLRVKPRKGIFFGVSPSTLPLYPKMLIYPIPPSLRTSEGMSSASRGYGCHTCPDAHGGMRLGPLDIPEEPASLDDYDWDAEKYRSIVADTVRPFLPFINAEQLVPDTAALRPNIPPFSDFYIRHEACNGLPGYINLAGIGSPGMTASPAIGEYVADLIDREFQQ